MGAGFWRLWTSSGLSNLADGALKAALPLVALSLTDSPLLIAGVATALSLPWLLCALPAGALADRLDRRRAMIGANVARTVLLLFLALSLTLGFGSLWLLYAVAFAIGVTETLYDTSAQSILPQLVPRARLSRANGRLYAAELTAQGFVGPPLGSALVAAGVGLAFVTPAALWAAAAGALLLVGGGFRVDRTGPATTLRAEIAEGVRFLWGNRLLRRFALMVGASNFVTQAAFAVLVLYAVGAGSSLRLPEAAFGLLLTAGAVGGLLGSFLVAWVERRLGRTWSLRISVLGFALFVGVPGLTTHLWVVMAGLCAGGAAMMVWNVIVVSLRQRLTPDLLLGRVNSVFRLLAWGTMPLGAATGGVLASLIGLRPMYLLLGGAMLLLLLPLIRLSDARMDAAEAVTQKRRTR
ncbi:MFS transporter [Nocardiopsis sp. MG754419]|nr:MFS transporter [Nocardiopsis sp. MG754419]